MAQNMHHFTVDNDKAKATATEHIEQTTLYPDASLDDISSSRLEAPELMRDLTPDERARLERKLVRKIDARLLPALIVMYILNYLDRNNIASARLTGKVGLQKDLGMTSTQFNTAVSILFVGYILMQVPSNLFLNKIGKPAIYLPIVMIIWGTISAATAAVHSYAGLVVVRFFLGFVEAAYFPGCLFFLSSWYTRKELAMRTAILYSGSLLSGAFSGLIAAGISSNLDNHLGISAWRWLFIIEGTVTVFIALLAFFVLPNFPATTTWLTPLERQLAVFRLQEDIGLVDAATTPHQPFFTGLTLAVRDAKTWLLLVTLAGIVSAASVTNFFPTVVATLGYSHVRSLLLTAPPYLLAVLATFANAWHADRTGERYLHIVLPLCISLVAFILAAATTSTAPRYVAMMLMPSSFYPAFIVGLAWISNCLPRPPAKRAAALALVNAVSNATSIYASYMYNTKYSPRYVLAMSINCATVVLAMLAATALRVLLVRLNARLARGEDVDGVLGLGGAGAEKRRFRFLV